jgi:hypothetical protein
MKTHLPHCSVGEVFSFWAAGESVVEVLDKRRKHVSGL